MTNNVGTEFSFLVNQNIKSLKVRLILEDGSQHGVVTRQEALTRANDSELDLIQVTDGEIPVCKITNADKFLYEKKKSAKEQARKQRLSQIETKEIQLRPTTDTNDINIKVKKAKEILSEGDKVKIIVKFRGRETSHKEIGRSIITEFVEKLGDYKLDVPMQDTGRDIFILVSPQTLAKED